MSTGPIALGGIATEMITASLENEERAKSILAEIPAGRQAGRSPQEIPRYFVAVVISKSAVRLVQSTAASHVPGVGT